MKSLHLESTEMTPEFLFDVENLTLSVMGASSIEKTNSYYPTITKFIDDIELGKPVRLKCVFDFKILCRTSKRGLLFFLLRLKDLQTNCGTNLIIDWVCYPNDSLVRSIGLSLDYMARLKINFIDKDNSENKVEEVVEMVF
tara:strand:+ start:6275 stop:6697 length:423 start_codon:yes stop_codon:yes gene_type:complete